MSGTAPFYNLNCITPDEPTHSVAVASRADDNAHQQSSFSSLEENTCWRSSSSNIRSGEPLAFDSGNDQQPEEKDISAFNQYSKNKRGYCMKGLRHVHNLCGKVLPYAYDDFQNSVYDQLPADEKELLLGCSNFSEFDDLLLSLEDEPAHYESILKASEKFCHKYNAVVGFWKQSDSLLELFCLGMRNYAGGASVAFSSSELRELLLQDELGIFKPVAGMLRMLVKYSLENAQVLERLAEEDEKDAAEIAAWWRQEQLQAK